MPGSTRVPLVVNTHPLMHRVLALSLFFSLHTGSGQKLGGLTLCACERATSRCFSPAWVPGCSLAGPMLISTLAWTVPWLIQIVLLFRWWLKSRRGWNSSSNGRKMKDFLRFSIKRPIFRKHEIGRYVLSYILYSWRLQGYRPNCKVFREEKCKYMP